MTKKDYIAIAKVLAECGDKLEPDAQADSCRVWIAMKLAAVLAKDNPAFRTETFLKAAGIG